MPRSPTKRHSIQYRRQTQRLVHEAITTCGGRKGATYYDIKRYVNRNTTLPYVPDSEIKNTIRGGVKGNCVKKEGVYYKKVYKTNKPLHTTHPLPMISQHVTNQEPVVITKKPTRVTRCGSFPKTTVYVILAILLFSMFVAVKAESDEDDNLIAEVVADLVTGIFVEMCMESSHCATMLTTFCFASLIVGLVITCVTGECFFKCDRRTARRTGTMYAGTQLRKWYR